MQLLAFIQPCDGNGYCARCVGVPDVEAHGGTRDEALDRLKELVVAKLANELLPDRVAQGELVSLDLQVPGEPNPLLALIGTWKDHPDLDEVEENIREYRRQIDADPDRP